MPVRIRNKVKCIFLFCRQASELLNSLEKHMTISDEEPGSYTAVKSFLVETAEIEVQGATILNQSIQLCDLPGVEFESTARYEKTREVRTIDLNVRLSSVTTLLSHLVAVFARKMSTCLDSD